MPWDFRAIAVMVAKELREAIRNRTVLLIVLLPLMASLAFSHLQRGNSTPLRVAVPAPQWELFARVLPDRLAEVHPYHPSEDDRIPGTPPEAGSSPFPSRAPWDVLIRNDPQLPAALSEGRPVQLRLVVNPQLGPMGRLAATQLAVFLQHLGRPPLVHVSVEGIPAGSAEGGLLAVWMTVTAIMIGIMIMGGNVAEERERGTWLALITAPVRLGEILGAKALFGVILTSVMGGLMLLAHRIPLDQAAKAMAVLLAGSACFTLAGLLLGYLAPNQATARSYGTLVYLPLLVPVFAQDASPFIARWSFLFPSYHLWAGLEKALLHGTTPLVTHALPLLGFSGAAAWCLALTVGRRRS